MNSQMSISQIIGKLNVEWFAAVKAEFEGSPFYNSKSKMIDDAIEEYPLYWDAQTGEEDEEKSKKPVTINIHAELPEYSWNGLPNRFLNLNEDDEPVLKAKSLFSDIANVVGLLLNEASGISEKQRVVLAVKQSISEAADILKSTVKNTDYHAAIDYCISEFIHFLSQKYWSVQAAHDTISEFEEKLLFNMNQNELALLLTVLSRADFIHGGSEKESAAHHFFSKYFYFKNQKQNKTFTRAVHINNKISAVNGFEITNLEELKSKLKLRLNTAIDKLQPPAKKKKKEKK